MPKLDFESFQIVGRVLRLVRKLGEHRGSRLYAVNLLAKEDPGEPPGVMFDLRLLLRAHLDRLLELIPDDFPELRSRNFWYMLCHDDVRTDRRTEYIQSAQDCLTEILGAHLEAEKLERSQASAADKTDVEEPPGAEQLPGDAQPPESEGPKTPTPLRNAKLDVGTDTVPEETGPAPEIPPLELGSGKWIKAKDAAKRDGLIPRTLAVYRGAGVARYVSSDKMSGIDRDGHMWRKGGTTRAHAWYFVKSLRSASDS